MLTWIKIMLFGGSTLITPEPVAIGVESAEVVFSEPIKALDKHASFNVKVSEYVESEHFQDFTREVNSKFPEGCIKIRLNSKGSDPVLFSKRSVTWNNPRDVSVNLKSEDGVPTDRKYTSLIISSCNEIKSTKITWYNYGKP